MKNIITLIPLFIFTLCQMLFSDSPKTFTPEQEAIKKQLSALFEVSKKVNSPKEKKHARGEIEAALDWEQISKDCLKGQEATKAEVTQKKEFQALLKEVVVNTAYSRLDTFWDGATYDFDKIKIEKGKDKETAFVSAKFIVKKEKFFLDYYLIKKEGAWKIYDIAFEDIHYSENIREQIQAFLSENKAKGFANLLEKLRKKKSELKS